MVRLNIHELNNILEEAKVLSFTFLFRFLTKRNNLNDLREHSITLKYPCQTENKTITYTMKQQR